jgi:TRAP-type C4-dicarboxylate transport system permease small subunit
MIAVVRAGFERLLEWAVIALMAAIAIVVLLGISFRTAGASLAWYDEVASILLAWLTYYGAALAALKRAHIGFPGLVQSLEPKWRKAAVLAAEAIVIGFFVLVAWVGLMVLAILEGDRMVSLDWMPLQVTQSVIPVGAALFIIAQLLSLPDVWRAAIAGPGRADVSTE